MSRLITCATESLALWWFAALSLSGCGVPALLPPGFGTEGDLVEEIPLPFRTCPFSGMSGGSLLGSGSHGSFNRSISTSGMSQRNTFLGDEEVLKSS